LIAPHWRRQLAPSNPILFAVPHPPSDLTIKRMLMYLNPDAVHKIEVVRRKINGGQCMKT
jgi:hypothetical protein